MAATPQWKINQYLNKIYKGELDNDLVRIVDVTDRNFCIAETAAGNRISIPWQQMESGFWQRVDD